jgi:hypothetical protein
MPIVLTLICDHLFGSFEVLSAKEEHVYALPAMAGRLERGLQKSLLNRLSSLKLSFAAIYVGYAPGTFAGAALEPINR